MLRQCNNILRQYAIKDFDNWISKLIKHWYSIGFRNGCENQDKDNNDDL